MNILIIYSSLTGNTKSIAKVMKSTMKEYKGKVKILPIDIEEKILLNEIDSSEIVAIGYWNDRGTADKKVIKLSEHVKNKKLILFGTQGACPESEHGQKCIRNAEELFAANKILGSFLCQGRIDPKLLEKFEDLPEDNPHYMTKERKKRHLEASMHPNQEDFIKVGEFLDSIFKEMV